MKKRIGNGQVFKVDPAGGSTFVTLGCLRNAVSYGMTRNVVDVSCIDDASDRKVGGSKNASDLTFEILYDPKDTTSDTLNGLADTGAIASWQIVWSTEGLETPDPHNFKGFVSGLTLNIARNEGVAASITVTVDDEPGFAAEEE